MSSETSNSNDSRRVVPLGGGKLTGRRKAYAAATGLVAMGVAATLVVTTGAGAPEDLTAATKALSGAPSCSTMSTTSRLAASMSDGFTAQGEEGSFTSWFLGELASGAVAWGEGNGLGWGLNMITGSQGDPNSDAIQKSIADVNSKVDAVQQQLSDMCSALSSELSALTSTVHHADYDSQAATLSSGALSDLSTYLGQYQAIRADLISHGGDIQAIDGDHLTALANLRSNLPRVITSISNALTSGSQPGAAGMIEIYSEMLADHYGYSPMTTKDQAGTGIYPAEFVNAGYDMIDYYSTLLLQAINLYSEVEHVSFKIDNLNYGIDSRDVQTQIDAVSKHIADFGRDFTWGEAASDNKTGMGRIPAGTFVDYRDTNNPKLWTDHPISAVDGSDVTDGGDAAFACGTTADYCVADDYDTGGHITSTRMIQVSKTAVAQEVGNLTVSGLAGWHLPSTSEWTTLAKPSSGKSLTKWGTAVGTPIFDSTSVDGHYGGQATKLTSIRPVLATADSGDYQLLGAPDAGASSLTTYPASSGQTGLAGRVFAVQNFVPGQAAPVSSSRSSDPSQHQPKKHQPKHQPKKHQPKKHHSKTAGRHILGSDDSAQTFTAAQACDTGSVYTVPDGVNAVKIEADGGAGAAGAVQYSSANGSAGGAGARVSAIVPVTPGSKLYVQVGGSANGIQGGSGGGANGGNGRYAHGGGGGGASGVSTSSDCSQWLLMAGGGGGGGATISTKSVTGHGGDAGWLGSNSTPAGDGTSASSFYPGGGKAGQAAPGVAGGAGGSASTPYGSTVGSAGTGGDNTHGGTGGGSSKDGIGGGGGGGGYFGGGGGGGAAADVNGSAGGGAGGNSYIVGNADYQSFGHNDAGAGGSVTITPSPLIPGGMSFDTSTTTPSFGQSPTLTAHVDSKAVGRVHFYDFSSPQGIQEVGSAPIVNGKAVLTLTTQVLSVGTHEIHAYLPSDGHYQEEWTQLTVNVVKATPSIVVTASSDMVGKDGKVSLTATMNPDINGSIVFYDDAQPTPNKAIGTAQIVDGVATLTELSRPLISGTNHIWVWFDGNDNYNTLWSDSTEVTVIDPAS